MLSPQGKAICTRIAERLTRYGTTCSAEEVAVVWSPAGRLDDAELTAAIELELQELGLA